MLVHGLLSGAWTKEWVEQGETARNASRVDLFQKGNIGENILSVEHLRAIAEEKQATLPRLVHAWRWRKGISSR